MAVAEKTARAPISQEALEQYRGKWVALRRGKVIAAGDTFEDLTANSDVEPLDAVYHVPESPGVFY
jgi:hypothetical protein